MLTNNNKWVLLILVSLLSFFMTSCWSVQENKKEDVKVISGEKNKALGGQALEKWSINIWVSNSEGNISSEWPNIIK